MVRLSAADIAGSLRAGRGVRVRDLVELEGAASPNRYSVSGRRSHATPKSCSNRLGNRLTSVRFGSNVTRSSEERTASRFLNRSRMSPPSAPIHEPWSEKTITTAGRPRAAIAASSLRQRLEQAPVGVGDLGGVAGLELFDGQPGRGRRLGQPLVTEGHRARRPVRVEDPRRMRTRDVGEDELRPVADPRWRRRERVEDPLDPVALLAADGVGRDPSRTRPTTERFRTASSNSLS